MTRTEPFAIRHDPYSASKYLSHRPDAFGGILR